MCDVLVLEDNDLVREFLIKVLETEGFEVAAFATPQGALGRMGSAPPCRMLATDVDLGVEGLDGFAVASKVRSSYPNLPVLYFSGRPYHFNDHPLGPCEDFLTKPFRVSDLLGKLHALGVGPGLAGR
ncbi:response regulator [Pararoseomonas sp. SCSIO 73927]|uniref:response regulator transcription factor n=1 Tax=Pararoseomonas sp. SCSIO 73927 TaxID=3114537 RepID=UPI0030D21214